MAGIRIDPSLERKVSELYSLWARGRATTTIVTLAPKEAGPLGEATYHWLPPAFIEFLRLQKFPFSEL
jgi:hypothetical protein